MKKPLISFLVLGVIGIFMGKAALNPRVDITPSAATAVATIPMGSGATSPMNVGVNPNTNRVYVANQVSNNTAVIDGATNTIITTVATGKRSIAVGVNPATNRIYIANFNEDTVSVIDGATNTVIATVSVGSNPARVEVNPVTNRIYVGNFSSNNISVIDGATNTVIATVPTGNNPEGVAVNPVTNRIYAGNRGSNNLTVIDGATNTVITTVSIGIGPIAAEVNPITNRIYVANFFSGDVSVIDGTTNAVIATVAAGGSSGGVGVNPNTNRIYVSNFGSSSVTVIDGVTNTAIGTVSVGNGPFGVRVNPNTSRIYVANLNTNDVSVIEDISGAVSDFRLVVNPVTQTVSPGASISFTVNVQAVNSFTQPVELSALVSPSNNNVAVNFSQNTVTAGGNATLTVSTTASTPPTAFNITITGKAGQLVHSQIATLNVVAENVPPTIAAIADQAVKAGDVQTVSVSASDRNGNTGLKLSLVSAPTFVALTDNGNGSGTIRITPAVTDNQGGTVLLQVTDPGGLSAQVSFNVTVLSNILITAASFAKPSLIISGSGFGSLGAKVNINGRDVSAFIIGQADTQINLKGNKRKLNFKKGANQITVTAGGVTSNTFILNLLAE
jgi:YVTN family beta-propeller protein